MSTEINVTADQVTIQDDPTGDGFYAVLTTSGNALADWFMFEGDYTDSESVVVPLKHKVEGANNVSAYRRDGPVVTLIFTDEQFREVSERLQEML